MGKKKVIIMFFRVARRHDLERRKKRGKGLFTPAINVVTLGAIFSF
jgi:hypothetical protein